jgi:hypothetical protein
MQMTTGRRVAEAVGSWLHLEFCCYRAGLLSEGALKAAVGQVLSSFPISAKGTRVYADFPHEALNPVKRPGRKKEVDFALVLAGKGLPKKNAEVLVEAKWSNSSHCTPENVFTDFLRLAALKRADPVAKCLFILAGHSTYFNAITSGMPFICGASRNTGIGTSGNQKRVTPTPTNVRHWRHWKRSIHDLLADGLIIPDSFVTQACSAHPIQSDAGTVDFQSQCWEIIAVSNTNLKPAAWP